jgi:hypothetical protein
MFFLTLGVSGGPVAYGIATDQPLWTLAGGVTYGVMVTWSVVARDYKAQSAGLSFLGMTREDVLRRGEGVE